MAYPLEDAELYKPPFSLFFFFLTLFNFFGFALVKSDHTYYLSHLSLLLPSRP